MLKAFIAAVIGGFGSLPGAVLGGFLLGGLEVILTAVPGIGDILPQGMGPPAVQQFLQTYLPGSLSSWRDAFVFIILIIVLIFRPNGILGGPRREEMP